jgi:[acyl-carrier-protein] S-malonyltransferase
MTQPSTVALFPGQGSQHVGMLRELHDNFAAARQVFEEASDAIRLDLRKLCFDGPEADLILTENTQPCLLAASVAAFRAFEAETGFTPAAAAGHSLGEYSALVAAGALPLATAARWVRERGRAMQAAVPAGQGTMAALLGLEDAQVGARAAPGRWRWNRWWSPPTSTPRARW